MNLRCPDEFALGVVVGALLVTVVAPALTWSFLRVCRPCRERLRTQAATAATASVVGQRANLRAMGRAQGGRYAILSGALEVAIPSIEVATGKTFTRLVHEELSVPLVTAATARVGLPVP